LLYKTKKATEVVTPLYIMERGRQLAARGEDTSRNRILRSNIRNYLNNSTK
jgi:hypothetical protein